MIDIMIKYLVTLLYIFNLCMLKVALQDTHTNEDSTFWYKSAMSHLDQTLSVKNVEKKVKNVIMFVGDGMGLSTVTAGRIYKGQSLGFSGEEYLLTIDNFPNSGLAKTYNVNSQVTDSAAAATALFCGVKIRIYMLGLDARAKYQKCDPKLNKISEVNSIADWAQKSEKDTGFVTTSRITHATPAGLYAHINDRTWEADSDIPKKYKSCVKDIARQLIEDEPGKNFKVILGGGARNLCPKSKRKSHRCHRGDGKNLTQIWQQMNPQGKVATNKDELMKINVADYSKLLGVFSTTHLKYQAEKDDKTPSLVNMTEQAINFLQKSPNGFFLMVEGGKIDLAHHKNQAKLALDEFSDFDDAVKKAIQMVNLEETLIVVTADHSHAFTINGYPQRGNDILGVNSNDKKAYETLSYANGPAFNYHRLNSSNSVDNTWRPLNNDLKRHSDIYYKHFAGRYLSKETHGGEDVGVYAIGPYSHLFRGTFEQNYIPHALAYAACYKDRSSHCEQNYYVNL